MDRRLRPALGEIPAEEAHLPGGSAVGLFQAAIKGDRTFGSGAATSRRVIQYRFEVRSELASTIEIFGKGGS